jgi:hypothetical protein
LVISVCYDHTHTEQKVRFQNEKNHSLTYAQNLSTQKSLAGFTKGKTPHTVGLYHYFDDSFKEFGAVTFHPAKTMIGVSNGYKSVAWITAFGKNFIHVVFPFKQPYNDNLCFQKITQVPGHAHQFNHHYKMLLKEDLNDEVIKFMQLALKEEQ